MAEIYERLLSTNILREKRRESFDRQRENLLGEDNMGEDKVYRKKKRYRSLILGHETMFNCFQ